jgi:hypothetical protein
MPHYFLLCEREQVLLMAPSLCDWLPEDHLAWFVLASVEQSSSLTSGRSTFHIAPMVTVARRMIRR